MEDKKDKAEKEVKKDKAEKKDNENTAEKQHEEDTAKKKDKISSMANYTNALPVVTISVIENILFEAEKKDEDKKVPCVSYHVIMERESKETFMHAFSYVFIELGKFDDPKYKESNISEQERDWLLLFKKSNIDHVYANEQVNSAAQYAQHIRENDWDLYQRGLMTEQAEQNEIESAKKEGEIKGKIEGEIKGKKETAKRLLQRGQMSTSEIIEDTQLTKEELETIKEEIKNTK